MKTLDDDSDSSSSSISDYGEPAQKKQKDEAAFSLDQKHSTAYRLLLKSGYTEGKGMGKHEQGRINIVEATGTKGKRGFGFQIEEDKESAKIAQKYAWDLSREYSKEELYSGDFMLSFENESSDEEFRDLLFDLHSKEDSREFLAKEKTKIGVESAFCDLDLIVSVLHFKKRLDEINRDVRSSRSRSNPYEKIGRAIFLNRAAMKMANIDHLTDGKITTIVPLDSILHFADICAGPGGFSEYVLWRRCYSPIESENPNPFSLKRVLPVRGHGLTLSTPECKNKFTLDRFFSGPAEAFKDLSDSNGDVTDHQVLIKFTKKIALSTDNLGVHLVMADGGYDVSSDYNQQEILSHHIYIGQCLTALMILRPGGNFVTKLFDIYTQFSVHLIYLMSKCFAKITLIKPVTSRPANSERYLFCENLLNGFIDPDMIQMAGHPLQKGTKGPSNNSSTFKPPSSKIAESVAKNVIGQLSKNLDPAKPLYNVINYLANVNTLINEKASGNAQIPSFIQGKYLVHPNNYEVDRLLRNALFMQKCRGFVKFIQEFNRNLAIRQCGELSRIPLFKNDSSLCVDKEGSIGKHYLKLWKIPILNEQLYKSWLYNSLDNATIKMIEAKKANLPLNNLTIENEHFEDNFGSRFCAIFLPFSLKPASEIISISRGFDNEDIEVDGKVIRIPHCTTIYGVMANEYMITNNLRKDIFWVVDSSMILGKDISNCDYLERMRMVQEMIESISIFEHIKLRTMKPFPLTQLQSAMDQLCLAKCKDKTDNVKMYIYPNEGQSTSKASNAIYPVGLIMNRMIKGEWKYLKEDFFYCPKEHRVMDSFPENAKVVFRETSFSHIPFTSKEGKKSLIDLGYLREQLNLLST